MKKSHLPRALVNASWGGLDQSRLLMFGSIWREVLVKKKPAPQQHTCQHTYKAVQQASGMEGGWLATVRKSTPLQFGVSRGRSEVLLSGCGRVYLSEIVSEFGPKTWPRCRDNLTRWLISTQAHGH